MIFISLHSAYPFIFSYDNHLIIRALATKFGASNISLIGSSKETFSKIETRHFVFLDSYSHLNDSLDTLASNLRSKGPQHFTFVRNEFPDDEKFELCLQKLVYPYSFMDSFERFDERIPPIEYFYNELTESHIEQSEYDRLMQAREKFNIVNRHQNSKQSLGTWKQYVMYQKPYLGNSITSQSCLATTTRCMI